METNQFIKATVGVVVVFLVIIAVAIPIIGGFTESSPGETGTNEYTSGNYAVYIPKAGTSITLTDGALNINGEDFINYNSTISFGNCMLSLLSDYYSIEIFGDQYLINSTHAFNLTYDGNRVTGIIETTTKGDLSIDTETAIYLQNKSDSDADYVWAETALYAWSDGTDYHTNSNTVLYAVYSNVAFYRGTVNDMIYYGTGDESMTITTTAAGDDSLIITGVSTTTLDTHLYVPETYYAVEPVEPQVSGPVADMVNLVPLLLIVGLIIAAVAAFITLKSRGGGA